MYTKEQLLNLRHSPLSQGRPKELGTIPGITKDTSPLKSRPKRQRRHKSMPPKQEPPVKEPLKFHFITRMSGLNGEHFQENYMPVGLTPQGIPIYQKRV
tara:strand:- start:296 stop:592 length:297 start_codon:yes stop_codon:yes gene_type:complete